MEIETPRKIKTILKLREKYCQHIIVVGVIVSAKTLPYFQIRKEIWQISAYIFLLWAVMKTGIFFPEDMFFIELCGKYTIQTI